MKLDIEYLMDLVLDYMNYEREYQYANKNNDLEKVKEDWVVVMESQNKIYDICRILNIDENNLFSIARSIKKWREKTKYEHLLTDEMKMQIANYLFGRFELRFLGVKQEFPLGWKDNYWGCVKVK